MKNFVIILFCVLVSSIALGQNQKVEEMKNVLKKSEVEVTPPKFTGIEGVSKVKTFESSIANYLASHFDYYDDQTGFDEGTEVLQFNVTPTGAVTNIKIINSVSPEIDNEVIRILKTTNGMWLPGYNNGSPVAMQKEVALEIQARNVDGFLLERDFTKKAQYYFTRGTKNFFVKKNFKRALKNYDLGIKYKPYDKSLRYIRGMCRYELGYLEGARQDWQLLKDHGGIDMSETLAGFNLKDLNGYEEYIATIQQQEE